VCSFSSGHFFLSIAHWPLPVAIPPSGSRSRLRSLRGSAFPGSKSFSRRVFGKPSNHFSARRGRGASQKNGKGARDAKHPVRFLGGYLASCAQRLSTLQPGSSLKATKRGGITSPKRGQGWLAVNHPAAGASMKSGAWRSFPSVAERQFPPRSSSRNPPPKNVEWLMRAFFGRAEVTPSFPAQRAPNRRSEPPATIDAYAERQARQPSPFTGEGGSAQRNRVRGNALPPKVSLRHRQSPTPDPP
jgi:hypothetical protein